MLCVEDQEERSDPDLTLSPRRLGVLTNRLPIALTYLANIGSAATQLQQQRDAGTLRGDGRAWGGVRWVNSSSHGVLQTQACQT